METDHPRLLNEDPFKQQNQDAIVQLIRKMATEILECGDVNVNMQKLRSIWRIHDTCSMFIHTTSGYRVSGPGPHTEGGDFILGDETLWIRQLGSDVVLSGGPGCTSIESESGWRHDRMMGLWH